MKQAIKRDDKLTFKLRIKLCFEILTKKSDHETKVKELSVFQCGYSAGFLDAMPKLKFPPIFRNDVV